MLESIDTPSLTGTQTHTGVHWLTANGNSDVITIPDAHLLFAGDFKRVGTDLILSDAQHNVIVHDYFRGDKHPTLLSPEGAQLSSDIVEALTGHGSYAQAGPQQANTEVIARVATVQGNATVVRNGVAVVLNVGDAIQKGDVLQTGNGALGVTFIDGSTLNLTANARLAVNDFVYDPHGASNSEILNLVQGSLTFISGQIAHGGNMKIGTPVATMGIRGTVGGVTEANDGTVQFYVVQSDTGAFILDSSGTSIAQVIQNGPLIVIHPAGPLQVVAEEVQKTPAELAVELSALQHIVSVQAIGNQIIQQFQQPNPQSIDHPHTQIEIDIPYTVLASHTNSGSGPGDSGTVQTNTDATVKFTPLNTNSDPTYIPATVPIPQNLPPVIVSANSSSQISNDVLSTIAATYLVDNHNFINTLGGTNGFGDVVSFQPDYSGVGGVHSDDGSTLPIDITSVFGTAGLNFFGSTYDALYINNNGNVTFAAPNNTYIPGPITGGPNNPIIAAFWSDVDTRGGALPTNTGGNSAGTNQVYYSLDPTNHVVTITWDDVGSYNSHTNAVDAFQLQLIGLGNGNFDIVFRYESINWVTGDVSGGVAAQAGYSAGDGDAAHAFALPQSGDTAALLALPSTAGNTGIDGVDVFSVISGDVAAPAVSGTIQFVDPDANDTHTATVVNDGPSYVGIMTLDDPANNDSHLTEPNGTTPGSVAWHLDLTPDQIYSLPANQTITQSYGLTITDNHGGTTAQTISVSIGGPGSDNFVFHADQHVGADTIANFNTNSNTIELDGYGAINNANLAAAISSNGADASHGDAVINLGFGDSITMSNVTESYLQQHLNLIHLNSGVV